ncbi:MAG: 50S ribosomal protein L21 [Candidatus Paceibacterota bacterium]|jgi:large subunit ribosomal protein L21|nr:50S ribosomal protein L21 [Candidatus Paceibacterota bacterium]MDD4874977.1 50S ribosomal protein L21 [Candidatus Paceibacterota bacterium]
MLAVIKTGGKQYVVEPGKKLKIEKLDKEIGEIVDFGEVLLIQNGEKTEIGSPFLKGAKVTAKILAQGKAKKTVKFMYKAKKRSHTKTGHRQMFTEVEIAEIKA